MNRQSPNVSTILAMGVAVRNLALAAARNALLSKLLTLVMKLIVNKLMLIL